MTEYDYSPEAYERYLATQHRIARWVDGTSHKPLSNPFTTATPIVRAMQELQLEDDERDHRSSKHRRHRDRDRDRDMRDRSRDGDYVVLTSTRHRSSSHSAAPSRPTHTRSHTAPPRELDHPRHPISPHKPSRHSSRSSSSTRPHSASTTTTHFTQPPPPVPYIAHPQPRRSNTAPVFYNHPGGTQSKPVIPSMPQNGGRFVMVPNQNPRGGSMDLGARPMPNQDPRRGSMDHGPRPMPMPDPPMSAPVIRPLQNAPQLPYSAYQSSPTKQLPLLKRLFTGLTGGNKHHPPSRPRRKRSSSF